MHIESEVINYKGHFKGWSHTQKFLCGVDDGREFETQIPATIDTVDGALAWLRPKLADRANAQRQGDIWYAPVNAIEAQKLSNDGFLGWDYLRDTCHAVFHTALGQFRTSRNPERRHQRAVAYAKGDVFSAFQTADLADLYYHKSDFRRYSQGVQVFDTRHHVLFGDLRQYGPREEYAIGLLIAPDHLPVFLADWHRLDRNNRIGVSARGGD